MTRINLVDPEALTNAHLQGEYKEISRVFTLVSNNLVKGKKVTSFNIPLSYCLGPGHVTFFYNKLGFVLDRYRQLYVEMRSREFKPSFELFTSVCSDAEELIKHNKTLDCHYVPSPNEIYLNMARLCVRSKIPRVLAELDEHKVTSGNIELNSE